MAAFGGRPHQNRRIQNSKVQKRVDIPSHTGARMKKTTKYDITDEIEIHSQRITRAIKSYTNG